MMRADLEFLKQLQVKLPNQIELDRKVAKIMGLEISEWEYRSLDPVQPTVFTNPPRFSVDPKWVDAMLRFAKQHHIKITSYDPAEVCRQLIAGCMTASQEE